MISRIYAPLIGILGVIIGRKGLTFHKQTFLGRLLGPIIKANEMAQNVLTLTGHIDPRHSVRRLTLVKGKKGVQPFSKT